MVGGHGVPAEVHPSGISMHTSGNSGGAPVVPVHCFVFGGHTKSDVPCTPVAPCGPLEPDGAGGHKFTSWFIPAGPVAGVFSTDTAYDAVCAGMAVLVALDAVVARIL